MNQQFAPAQAIIPMEEYMEYLELKKKKELEVSYSHVDDLKTFVEIVVKCIWTSAAGTVSVNKLIDVLLDQHLEAQVITHNEGTPYQTREILIKRLK